jgi:uncharacterized protein (TIGR02598 family)
MKGGRPQAFSLVEVVLALGVIAFALTAMLGLLVVAMDSDKSSGSDTALAAMSRQVFSDLRAMPYANLPAGADYYFDADGSECPQAGAVYGCHVTVADDSGVASGNLKKVQMTFSWPPSAAKPETKNIHGSIANHGP